MAIDRTKLIERIKEIDGLTNDERSSLLELLRTTPKYGLVWENKPEDVELQMQDQLPVLTEVKEKAIITPPHQQSENQTYTPNHILIEGDNLHALTALTYTHEGKIDVIYIDPPYNTGNKDFIYNDSYVDREDGYRHSKWLSFMAKRLRIAKRLLSENGVIFISIDDNEQAQLKLLCDEIFMEANFMGDVSWQRTYSPRNDSQGISNEKEHLLVYRNSSWTPGKLPWTDKMDSKYKNPDNDDRPWTSSDAFAPSAATHQGMVYAIQHPITGQLVYPYKGACWPLRQSDMLAHMRAWGAYELKDLDDAAERAAVCGIDASEVRQGVMGIVLSEPFEIAQKKAIERYNQGKWPYFYFTNKGKGGFRRKTYKKEDGGKVVTNLWLYEDVGHTDEAAKELKAIFGDKPFSTPKPTKLISRVIRLTEDKNITVLDFFAGSGTTLHATMKLNAEDGGRRQCILVTNNENGICENVTYERNRRVIQGYTTPKGEDVPGLKHNSLRYYRTEFVPRERTQKNMRQLMSASTDLLCIKNDLYTETGQLGGRKMRPSLARHFKDGDKEMLIIYDDQAIPYIAEMLKSVDVKTPILTYVFSPNNYPYTDEFYEVADKVKLCALPAAIYDAYRKVLKKPRPRYLETGTENVVTIEENDNIGGLFDTTNEEGVNA